MKKLILIGCGLLTAAIVSACQGTTDNQTNELKQQDPMMNVTYNGGPGTTQKSTDEDLVTGNFGYVHYKRDPGTNTTNISQKVPKIDPQELADVVTRLEIALPHVYNAATLATDRYLLIGYHTDSKDRETIAQQVKQTAYSIAPRYYDIYISDRDDAIDQISRFQHLGSTTNQVDGWLKSMIQEMKTAPQGDEFYKKNKPADPGDET